MAGIVNPNLSVYNNIKPKYPKKVANKPSIGGSSMSPPGLPLNNGMTSVVLTLPERAIARRQASAPLSRMSSRPASL